MKTRLDSIKFGNGPKGNQYVVVFSTDVVTKLLAGDLNTVELLQRSLKNADKDWREFAYKDDSVDEPSEQLTIDSLPLINDDNAAPNLDTAKVEVEETTAQFTY